MQHNRLDAIKASLLLYDQLDHHSLNTLLPELRALLQHSDLSLVQELLQS